MRETTSKANAKKASVKQSVEKQGVEKLLTPKSTISKDVMSPQPVVTKAAEALPKQSTQISDDERYRMIAVAAYYHAESHQFKSDPVRDWIDAEKDIAALLSEK